MRKNTHIDWINNILKIYDQYQKDIIYVVQDILNVLFNKVWNLLINIKNLCNLLLLEHF